MRPARLRYQKIQFTLADQCASTRSEPIDYAEREAIGGFLVARYAAKQQTCLGLDPIELNTSTKTVTAAIVKSPRGRVLLVSVSPTSEGRFLRRRDAYAMP